MKVFKSCFSFLLSYNSSKQSISLKEELTVESWKVKLSWTLTF